MINRKNALGVAFLVGALGLLGGCDATGSTSRQSPSPSRSLVIPAPAPTQIPAEAPKPEPAPVTSSPAKQGSANTKPAGAASQKPKSSQGDVYYKNCAAARRAGAAPILRGEPGYRPEMDGDGDGIACEPIR